mgnify:CR=1 FL=1
MIDVSQYYTSIICVYTLYYRYVTLLNVFMYLLYYLIKLIAFCLLVCISSGFLFFWLTIAGMSHDFRQLSSRSNSECLRSTRGNRKIWRLKPKKNFFWYATNQAEACRVVSPFLIGASTISSKSIIRTLLSQVESLSVNVD